MKKGGQQRTIKKSNKVSQQEKETLLEKAEIFLKSDTVSARVTKGMLAVVALGGIVCAGAVAPGMMRAVRTFQGFADQKEKSAKSTFYKLKRDGLILLKKQADGKIKVLLTEKGWKYMRRHFGIDLAPKQKLIWDRKWRVLIFDIPAKKNAVRNIFRETIKKFGFLQMQKSVWVYPYPCEDEILFLAKRLGIIAYVEVLTVKKMIHEEEIRTLFDL